LCDSFRPCVERRWNFLGGLFPPARNEAPTHRDKLPAGIRQSHNVDRCCRGDVVARPQVLRRQGQPIKLDHAPRVALGEASAHGASLSPTRTSPLSKLRFWRAARLFKNLVLILTIPTSLPSLRIGTPLIRFFSRIFASPESGVLIGRDDSFGHQFRHPASVRFRIIQCEHAWWRDRQRSTLSKSRLKCAHFADAQARGYHPQSS
jgi:hypothetical protein